ncbi:lytic murein transglycosylase [Ferrimonas sediminicola]|uniref:Lytic murein transglycosylase n=1 Tax=Ferrimonas sediminicola TaxID=2569538 RepID=A0A4V5NX03_9GAMM|nr:transglycosylase SLT domain-containing protein [Ferrimonas sediminicola]TKB48984.1 lytic murein transglycosylase [Ferrimonas sediminicola]
MGWSARSLILIVTLIGAQAWAQSGQRLAFEQAMDAIESGDQAQYHLLRKRLKGYPLTPYLEFEYRTTQIDRLTTQQAVEILTSLSDTPLYDSFKHRFLMQAGKRKRWQSFVDISPQPPRNTDLRCYYYRAQLALGNTDLAWAGTDRLWLTPRSLPEACTPLLTAWRKAGRRSNDLIWQRMLLTFDAGQGQRLAYLNTLLKGEWKRRGERLVRLYRAPREVRSQGVIKRHPQQAPQMAALALRRLARQDPGYALKQYHRWQGQLGEQEAEVRRNLLRRALADNLWTPALAALMEQYPEDDLIIQRTRQLIGNSDWAQINLWLSRIQEVEADDWRYWRARALEELGLEQEAMAAYRELAGERSYYGFLVAQRLGQPYRLNSALPSPAAETRRRVGRLPALARITELMALERLSDAREEWRWQLLRLNREEQHALTALANARHWHFLTVQGTIATRSWDAIPWRFPAAYSDEFNTQGKRWQLDPALLRAIARRESALYPRARSGANAYGLMQLLPATAKETARRIGADYTGRSQLYEPGYNIRLGSAYINQLLERYQGNRILATAAYNAGPHRVSRWLKRSDGGLSPEQWVETIPFRETRDYVKAVLSYQLIYNDLLGTPSTLLSEEELTRRY